MIQFRKVTWYSKLLAVLLFLATFAAGFYLGMEYADVYSENTSSAARNTSLYAFTGSDPAGLLDRARITVPDRDISLTVRDGQAEFIDPETGQSGEVSIDSVRGVWESGTRTDVAGVFHVTVGNSVSHSYLAVFSIRAGRAIQQSIQLLGNRVQPSAIEAAKIVNPLPEEDYIVAVRFTGQNQLPPQFFLMGDAGLTTL